jgi:hypothetical protein
MRRTVFGALALVLAAGAAHGACRPGLREVTTAQLFFGLDTGVERGISEGEWGRFLDTEVTPRFPDGLSVWGVAGQWKDPAGTLSREPAKTLLIVLSGVPGEDSKLQALIDVYKSRFHQQSVLLVEAAACAAF